MYFSECMEQDKIGKCSLIAVQCFLIIRLFGDIMQFERIFFSGHKRHSPAYCRRPEACRNPNGACSRSLNSSAAKLRLGKNKLSVVVSKQRASLHGRRDWLPAEFKDSSALRRYFQKGRNPFCPAACCPGYLTSRGILMSGS